MFKKEGTFFQRHKSWVATTTLIGTIVGAGILAIPYVVAKAGIWYGLGLIILMGISFLFLNLFLGEIVLRTKEQHQLTGYASLYLGPWGKRLMTFSFVFVIYGALTAYLIGEGETLATIIGVGHPLLYSLLFFLIATTVIIIGVKAAGKAELILIFLLVIVIMAMGLASPWDKSMDGWAVFNPLYLFLPYGTILFAMMGTPAIPLMQEVLGRDKKKLRTAIIVGTLIPLFLYLLFTIIVLGQVSLEQFEQLAPNQRIATIALSKFSFPLLGLFANVLAVLAMFTSYLTLGTALAEMYTYDYLLSRRWALLLTFLLPFILAMLGLSTFFIIIAVAGAVAGGLEGILLMLMYWKAKRLGTRTPEYTLPLLRPIGIFLIILFALGIFYQTWVHFVA